MQNFSLAFRGHFSEFGPDSVGSFFFSGTVPKSIWIPDPVHEKCDQSGSEMIHDTKFSLNIPLPSADGLHSKGFKRRGEKIALKKIFI